LKTKNKFEGDIGGGEAGMRGRVMVCYAKYGIGTDCCARKYPWDEQKKALYQTGLKGKRNDGMLKSAGVMSWLLK
jgi:hypothetical protein